MVRCNDCACNSEVGLVRGVSHLAGGEYYHGLEICERCMIDRRERAIRTREAQQDQPNERD